MLGHSPFNHDTIKKMTIIFGSLFNDIKVNRTDSSSVTVKVVKVPINYGPADPQLLRTQQTPDTQPPVAMVLPAISYELMDMVYDPARQLPGNNITRGNGKTVYSPVPFNFFFNLYVMANKEVDGTRIIEQILPFFTPSLNIPVKVLESIGITEDVPVIFTQIMKQDNYQGPIEDRRTQIWTLSFVLKGFLYGPPKNENLIKHVESILYTGLDIAYKSESIIITPGSTSSNTATTDINLSRPWVEIEPDDNWDFISQIVNN